MTFYHFSGKEKYKNRLENGVWQLKQKLQSAQVHSKDLFSYSVAIAVKQVFVDAVGTKVGNKNI
ncbi:MAG: hypothetical protein V7K85_21550 [Nostoc sp.]